MAYRAVRNQLEPETEKIKDQLEKLEESIAVTDGCVVDVYGLEERVEDRLDHLEEELMSVNRLKEELASVKMENIEMKNHLNSVIKELNGITELLNERHGDLIEKTYELDR